MDTKTKQVTETELRAQSEFAEMVKTILDAKFTHQPAAFVRTYGCQGNVADGERLKGMLEDMGYRLADTAEEADFILFNTCAIREHAEDRVFGNVGALKHKKHKNPNLVIGLCGCMMQQAHVAEKIKKSYPFVDLVFGTHVIHKLPSLVYRTLCDGRTFEVPDETGRIVEGLPVHRDGSIKAWLPIMYGCNNFCSYCVVPYVRGRERSRELDAVVSEARELVAAGYKEITLLGQNVNSYGKDLDTPVSFSELLREINSIPGEFRIRFMTSHPKDCTHELIDTIAACEKVSRHLHLPFQSGNNRVLDAMNRKYTRESYLELVQYAKKTIPGLSMTSDVIVGFPGETYEEFQETLSLVDTIGFTSLFTFIFSPRKGTPAAELEDLISHKEKAKWFKELTDLQAVHAGKRTAAMLGGTYRVLVENALEKKPGWLAGRTDENVIIEFKAPETLVGSFCDVAVTEALTWIVKGELMI